MRRVLLLLLISILLLVACKGTSTTAIDSNTPLPPAVPGDNMPPAGPILIMPSGPTVTPTIGALVADVITTGELHRRLDPFDPQAYLDEEIENGQEISPCELPCYNGLTPGDTGKEVIYRFYKQLGINMLDVYPGDFEIFLGNNETGHVRASLTKTTDIDVDTRPSRVDLYAQNGRVLYVYVAWDYLPDYLTFSIIHTQMGAPDQFLIGRVENDYIVQIVYDTRKTGFRFVGSLNNSQICLTAADVTHAYFGVFAPEEIPMDGLSNSEMLKPVDQALGISFADFAAQIDGGQCVNAAGLP